MCERDSLCVCDWYKGRALLVERCFGRVVLCSSGSSGSSRFFFVEIASKFAESDDVYVSGVLELLLKGIFSKTGCGWADGSSCVRLQDD